jgi:hypothetical protein
MSVRPIFSDSFYQVQAIKPAGFEVNDGTICMVGKKSLSQRVKEWFIGCGAGPQFQELVKNVNQVKSDAIQLNLLEDEILKKGCPSNALQGNLQALQHFIDCAKPSWLHLFIIRITNVARSIFHSAPIEIPFIFPDVSPLIAMEKRNPGSRAEDAKKCLYEGELLVRGSFVSDEKSFPECLQKLELGSAKCIPLQCDPGQWELKLAYSKARNVFILHLTSLQEVLTDWQIYAAFEEWSKLPEPRLQTYLKVIAVRKILEGGKEINLHLTQSFTFKKNGLLEHHYVIDDVCELKPNVKYTICLPGPEKKGSEFQFIVNKKDPTAK